MSHKLWTFSVTLLSHCDSVNAKVASDLSHIKFLSTLHCSPVRPPHLVKHFIDLEMSTEEKIKRYIFNNFNLAYKLGLISLYMLLFVMSLELSNIFFFVKLFKQLIDQFN